jgi:phosphate transport system permease protein
MFNWTSRPDVAFHHNAAAAGVILVAMTLSMNALAIYIRYRLRKNITW